MNSNKVIDIIYKKLLLNNFDHTKIRDLLFSNNEFYSFHNFLYYLFKLSKSKDSSLNVQMMKSIEEYINDLIDIHNINGYEQNFEQDKNYYDVEIEAFSKTTNNIIQIEQQDFTLYGDVLIMHSTFKLNNIIKIFQKNKYIGEFKSVNYVNYFLNDLQITATLYININSKKEYLWKEINNLIISNYWESLFNLKNNLIALFTKNKINNPKIYNNIWNSNNHFSCFNYIYHYLILESNNNLFNDFYNKYSEYLNNYSFNINLLIPNISLLSSQELALITNGYDIFIGKNISVDYRNNIYILLDKIEFINQDELEIDFLEASDGKIFDCDINKMILNSLNNKNNIYIFSKRKNKMYFFNGIFKCKKINMSNDNKPSFVLIKKKNIIEVQKDNIIDNSYKNIFINKISDKKMIQELSTQNELVNIISKDIQNEQLDSLLYKYNWIIRKYIKDHVNINFINAYIKLDNNLLNNILNVETKNYKNLLDNKIVSIWSLINELYIFNKNKSLLSISYFNDTSSIIDKISIIKSII